MLIIHEYNPAWPHEFQQLAADLREALGPLAVRIDHIGSTAVPGLAAKDRIDLQISVHALDEPVITALSRAGYQHVPSITHDHCPPDANSDPADWQKQFYRPPPGQRPTNTHVRVLGRANQRYALLFRDYLRAHPATADAYAELKRRLAAHLADPEAYPDVKDPAVDLIYLAAEAWAATNNWQSGPADA